MSPHEDAAEDSNGAVDPAETPLPSRRVRGSDDVLTSWTSRGTSTSGSAALPSWAEQLARLEALTSGSLGGGSASSGTRPASSPATGTPSGAERITRGAITPSTPTSSRDPKPSADDSWDAIYSSFDSWRDSLSDVWSDSGAGAKPTSDTARAGSETPLRAMPKVPELPAPLDLPKPMTTPSAEQEQSSERDLASDRAPMTNTASAPPVVRPSDAPSAPSWPSLVDESSSSSSHAPGRSSSDDARIAPSKSHRATSDSAPRDRAPKTHTPKSTASKTVVEATTRRGSLDVVTRRMVIQWAATLVASGVIGAVAFIALR